MAFTLRRATARDADEIANVYSASFRLLTFLPMLHTTDEYRWFIANVILKVRSRLRRTKPGSSLFSRSWERRSGSYTLALISAGVYLASGAPLVVWKQQEAHQGEMDPAHI